MKKTKLINSNISFEIADLGHTDLITISDAGLPIPKNVKKIDLAVKLGIPSFLEVLETVSEEGLFEEVYFSKDIKKYYPSFDSEVKKLLNNKNLKSHFLDHEEFKKLTAKSKAIIRTGEAKWFHNVILKAGVTF